MKIDRYQTEELKANGTWEETTRSVRVTVDSEMSASPDCNAHTPQSKWIAMSRCYQRPNPPSLYQ
jgi:hypothetical protein